MMKYIIMLSMLLSCASSEAQLNKFDNIWKVGTPNKQLEFNGIGAPPNAVNYTVPLVGNCFFVGGHSNICDTNGNLVFSTDGFAVFDNGCNIMSNGDSLVGKEYMKSTSSNNYPQTSIILPFPNKKYYIFTPSVSDSEFLNNWNVNDAVFDLLLYHKVDMNANGGAGAVIEKGKPILENVKLNKANMMACRHGNGKDWWLFKQTRDTNMVYKLLVTEDSIYNYGTQGFAEPHFGIYDQSGQAMFSNNGDKYAVCVRGAGLVPPDTISPGKIFVSDFDRCTGLLSNPRVYQTKPSPCANLDPNCFENMNQGLCFSPNGRFLYVSSYYSIKQLDTWDADTSTQWSYIYGPYAAGYLGSIYQGPDEKLYIGNFTNSYMTMSLIDSPDVKGNGCNFCSGCIQFQAPNYGITGPPCMPNYHLGALQPCWPLSTEEQVLKNIELEIYPNPASSVLYIKTESKASRELYNSVGQLLYTTRKNEIDVSKFSKGIYYIRAGNYYKEIVIE